MQSVVFRFDVLVAVVDSNNHVRTNAVDVCIERVHFAFDLRDGGGLRLLPSSARILPAHAVNPIVRVLTIGFVDATNLHIHKVLSVPPYEKTANRGKRIIR